MGKLYIVHSVDVEGPMTETLHATFERMQAYGLPDSIEPSDENLNKLQNGTFRGLDPSLSQLIQNIFNKESLSYLNNWDEIDEMLSVINSEQFRNKYSDKNGNPYLLSWFIYDHHEGFTNNPRFHEVGTHKIFDHYIPLISNNNYNDEIYWHYHAPAFSGDALESNTCWSNHAMHEEIISKRIIDKQWYFSCYRAGMCIENNDSSHWLEMFIPFDFTPRMHENHLDITKVDFDWRGIPKIWGAWHPDWYDYRKPGSMKRYMFRTADLNTYNSKLSFEDVSAAFIQAKENGKSVLSYFNHDYRDMRPEINMAYEIISQASEDFPDVEWEFCSALEAAQKYLNLNNQKPKLNMSLVENILHVKSNTEIFGPQPFLAIKENDKYFRDNFYLNEHNHWIYKFRKFNDVQSFGIAANSPNGIYDIIVKHLK